MSLNAKIFLSFLVMIVIAGGIGFLGYKTAGGLTDSLEDVVNAEMPLNNDIAGIARGLESVRAVQQAMMNVSLPMERRAALRDSYTKEKTALVSLGDAIDRALAERAADVTGWAALAGSWKETRDKMQRWMAGSDKLFDLFSRWEATTILNPDQLLGNLQRYRGDHFALISRLVAILLFNRDDPTGNPGTVYILNFNAYTVPGLQPTPAPRSPRSQQHQQQHCHSPSRTAPSPPSPNWSAKPSATPSPFSARPPTRNAAPPKPSASAPPRCTGS